MARERGSLFSLNRGVVDRRALARIDVKRLALAAQVQTNWMPNVLGFASLRAGLAYIFGTRNNLVTRYVKFVFATDDTALLELTDSNMRIAINDVLLARPSVTTAIVNGTFPASLANWTDNDEAGATSSWVAPNYMQLVGSGTARAIREQQVTVAGANIGVEHGIRITIARGPVTLRIGSTSGGDEYLKESTLYTGAHSMSIVPTGDFYIRFQSLYTQATWVSNCTIESAGTVIIPTTWAQADLPNIRTDQSADVIFVACKGKQQIRIERRGTAPNARSWSVVRYAPIDGPFRLQNTTPTTLTPSALVGNITVTASTATFRTTHIGALFSITSIGQDVSQTGAADGVVTPSIRVTGIGGARSFTLTISGDASGSTVDLQRSYDDLTWATIGAPYSYTADGSVAIVDSLDNQIVFYRLILTTRVAPDSVTMALTIGSGSVRGVVRITDYSSATSVSAEVVANLGGTTASSNWQEGQWSDFRGWPTAVRLFEGRLWWAGQNGWQGSISDAFDAFDETFVGEAGPINRTIGSGPVDVINWLMPLKALVAGGQSAEYVARASSLDEILTPGNFDVKAPSTQGSGAVDSIKLDQAGYFVNRSTTKVFEVAFDLRTYDFASTNLMELAPELGRPGITRMDFQRLPDTRIHCVRSDGTAIVILVAKNEDVLALIPVTTNGYIEDVVVLPAVAGDLDDQVYYTVRRVINGSTVRYLEKWAQEIDCRGDLPLCKLADSHVVYSGVPTTTISAPHLANTEVVVWADGADVGTNDSSWPWTQRYTLNASGNATLAVAATNWCIGLGYTAQFQSAKLGSMSQSGSPLNQSKKIGHIGFILADTHPRGVRFGPHFDNPAISYVMDDLPLIENATLVGTATQTDADNDEIEFPGTWSTDTRVCLQAQAPRPATVVAVTTDLELN